MRRVSTGKDVPLTARTCIPYSEPERACESGAHAHGFEEMSAPTIPLTASLGAGGDECTIHRTDSPGGGGDECILNFGPSDVLHYREYIAACLMTGGLCMDVAELQTTLRT
jgi:hypothetical protein